MSLAVPVSPVQSKATVATHPTNQHMPPTPPPTVTSTDHHPLLLPDLHYPDARHYHQPPSDSTTTTQQQHHTHSATPPSQQQPAFRAKDDVSSRFDFPLPPRAARQTHDATCRQADGNTADNHQHHQHNHNHHNHDYEGSDNHSSHPRKPIDSLPTPPAATASGSAAAAATAAAVTITADTTTTTVVDPSVETDQLIANKTDDDYDIFVLKQATLYRRSKTSGARGPGLVHRGIGFVKRDAAGGPICAGEIAAAAASATPGSGRLKEDELAGRYGALPWLLFIRSVYHIPVALPCRPTNPAPAVPTCTQASIHPSVRLSISNPMRACVCLYLCLS